MADAVSDADRHEAEMSRRQALKRGAALGGAVLWVTPAVQVLSVTESAAEQPSGASGGPGRAEPRGKAKGRPFG